MNKEIRKKQTTAIIARVRNKRIKAGYTQESIAKRLGIGKATYAKYESRSPLPIDLLYPFCKLCKVNIEYILVGKGKLKNVSQKVPTNVSLYKREAEDFIKRYKTLNRKEQRAFEAILKGFG